MQRTKNTYRSLENHRPIGGYAPNNCEAFLRLPKATKSQTKKGGGGGLRLELIKMTGNVTENFSYSLTKEIDVVFIKTTRKTMNKQYSFFNFPTFHFSYKVL